ncbi:CpaD family pilus assembly protein [Rhabdaerophilum sp. SD176]|uniref:CpaD family pilus assembly protein n=1 Tax=Rhabdaerophilum sp. SD176 TaxID=2983548 RepID=UPI0024DFE6C5|nr:CpaD family pilus assembly protein [Rhabdaerophilum sp. SD176]
MRSPRQALNLAVLGAAGLVLAGCSTLRPTQKAFAPDEYSVRHPIKIATSQTHLDVFDTGRQLDRRQIQDLQEFGRDYARHGRGPIIAAIPSGAGGHAMMGAIRSALSSAGAHAPLQVTPYQADGRLGAAPIRLSFAKLQAQVASQCGMWPDDLAGGRDLDTWQNRPYYNLGCSYQSMLAAQVSDPIDLVRPRAEGQVDTVKRTKDIEALRKDQDPSTNWRKDDAKVKEAQQ